MSVATLPRRPHDSLAVSVSQRPRMGGVQRLRVEGQLRGRQWCSNRGGPSSRGGKVGGKINILNEKVDFLY